MQHKPRSLVKQFEFQRCAVSRSDDPLLGLFTDNCDAFGYIDAESATHRENPAQLMKTRATGRCQQTVVPRCAAKVPRYLISAR